MNKRIFVFISLVLFSVPFIARAAGFLDALGCINTGSCQIRDVETGVILLINWVLGGMAAIALLYFVWGGYQFLISGGNMERVQKGKQIMINTIFALILAFGSYIGVKFITNNLLNVDEEYQVTSICDGADRDRPCNTGERNYVCSGYLWTGDKAIYNGQCLTKCEIKSIDDDSEDWQCYNIEGWNLVDGTHYISQLCPGASNYVCTKASVIEQLESIRDNWNWNAPIMP